MFKTKFELLSFQSLQLLIGSLWLAIAGHFAAIRWLNPLTPAQLIATAINYPTRTAAMINGGLGLIFFSYIPAMTTGDNNMFRHNSYFIMLVFLQGLLIDLLESYKPPTSIVNYEPMLNKYLL